MAEARLKGKNALVTGAASGLGRAMALGLLSAGARVALADVGKDALAAMSGELAPFGSSALTIAVDLTKSSERRALMQKVTETFGQIDILVNCAGIGTAIVRTDFFANPVRFWEQTEDTVRRFFDVNAIAPFLLSAEVAPGMIERKWGRIINITTSLDSMLAPGTSGYGGTKASLEAHTATMAEDLRGTGVTANVLVPGGAANTAMVPQESGFDRSQLVQPECMVPPLLWLASDDSNETTNRRFVAAKWDLSLPDDVAAEKAGAPAGWGGLGKQALLPERKVS